MTARRKDSAKARGKDAATPSASRPPLVQAGWIVLLAAWAFVLVSIVGFNPADAPSHVVWPTNDPPQNPCGRAGAAIAYATFKTFGWPSVILVAGLGIPLLLSIGGARVSHPFLRITGLLTMTIALAGLNAVLMAGWSPLGGLAGGLMGDVVGRELVARFNVLGSTVWLLLMLAVGAVVAIDRLLISIPRSLAVRMLPVVRRAGTMAGSAGTRVRAAGGFSARLARIWKRRGPVAIRIDDLDDQPEQARPSRRGRTAAATSDADEGVRVLPKARGVKPEVQVDEIEDELGLAAAALSEDESADEAIDVTTEEDDDDLPGAPQVYDEAALREKIARLPVRFAHASKQSATDADLRDLQNVGELEGYRFPGMDLLEDPEANFNERLEASVREQASALEAALHEYRIKGEVLGIESGPVITLFHVKLAPGTRVSQLQTVSSDIARALKSVNIRIVANQAGRDTVGIEVPNLTKEKVRLKELMSNRDRFAQMKLPMFLGKDASGDPLIADLTEMPHMLIAGTTGSGKSVCMNTIIMSFLYTKKPNELKLVLVDPKMVEMSQFKDIPHLMCPVVTEMSKAAAILEWACKKMDERYELLAEAGCRDIAGYNSMSWEDLKASLRPQTPEEEARIPRRLPYMVFIIDELADLMMTNKEVEGSIIRIAQKARAVGIHLILATQRPQANVVTGLIKSNMPCRITFKVASGMDSRIVLDQKGGELLLGQGDMLFLSPRSSKLSRAQGTLVDDKEIRRVARFMRDVATPTFERQLIQLRSGSDSDEQRLIETENNSSASLAAAQEDPLFDRAVEIVLETKRGSVSLLQRRLAIGYTRASRLIDLMGIAGIISDHKGSVARDVIITVEEWEAMKRIAAESAPAPGTQQDLFGVEPKPVKLGMETEDQCNEVEEESDDDAIEHDESVAAEVLDADADDEEALDDDTEDEEFEEDDDIEDDDEYEEDEDYEDDEYEEDDDDESDDLADDDDRAKGRLSMNG
ncbi:MAG: DNA translocase FtsK [Phycisphaeraceae bacterium]|nr:DNA translocase FtsK [Phycisphaeraceae bacterium]MCW5755359.1 DNA translocase FtsK [Phycisphaeraceae bacterium]